MNREDRELLAELRRLNSDVVPLAMKIMDESVMVTAQEQYAFARRLMAMGRRLEERGQRTASGVIADVVEGVVVEGAGDGPSSPGALSSGLPERHHPEQSTETAGDVSVTGG